MNNTFSIFKLKNYNISKNEDGTFNCDCYTGSIDKIINRLEKDKGYNLRIDPTKRCILFGDLDHIPSEDIFNKFIQLLCVVFDVTKDKVSYTSSIKPTEFSYHWSIPSIEASPKILKKTLNKTKFDEFRSYIDLSIYDSHWFRLPNQTNLIKLIPHKIINGKMADFIVDFVENCDETMDDEVVVEPSVKPRAVIIDADISDTINKCLQCIQADNYDVWMKVALIINNEMGFNGLDVLNEWSKTGSNYNSLKVANFYKEIKPKDNGLKIGSLKKMAKEEDPELYKQLFSKKKVVDNDDQTKINYLEIKNKFELNNFKVINPIMFVTIDKTNNIILRTKKDFKDVYENLVYLKFNNFQQKMILTSFVDDWLTDSEMRTYDKLDFLPMQTAPANIYNTFNGYAGDKKELFNVDINNSLIIKHIKNLCNNDEKVFDYVIKYFARKLQRPYELTNTALIFKSNEGAGKDLFFNYLGNKIIGSDYYFNTEKPELLFGKFTSSLENKILIVVNETSGKDTFQINENIKCAITAEFNTIEHKGLKPYKNTNHIGYIYLTNNDNPVKVPIDDRRFCGIECNNLICNNKEYFDALRTEINSGKYDKAFYNYLLNIDTDNYDFTNNRPKTNFYNDLQEMNKPTLILFLEQFINKNNDDDIIEVSSTLLFTQFNEFVNKFNFKCVISLTKFMMDLKKIDGTDTKRTKTSRYVLFDKAIVKLFLTNKYNIEFCDDEDQDDDIINNGLDA